MADIDSYGYNGSIASTDWPFMQLSPNYYVAAPGDLTCTPLASGTRQVKVNLGACGGYNVRDKVNVAPIVTLPAVSSGTAYSMIAMRRTWTDTAGSSAPVAIPAASGATLLPSRNTSPGLVDDQPLAMMALNANDTVPTLVADLRVLGSPDGDQYIRSALALQYLGRLGATYWLGDNRYRYRLNAAGTGVEPIRSGPDFRNALTTYSNSSVIDYATSWGYGSPDSLGTQGVLNGNLVQIDLIARRYDSSIQFNSSGGLADNIVGTLAGQFRPQALVPVTVNFAGGPTDTSFSSYSCDGIIGTNGNVAITSGPANLFLSRRLTNDVSIRIHAVYLRSDAS